MSLIRTVHSDMIRMRKTRLSAAVVLGVAAVMTPLAALAGPASAATAATNPNTPETVASGINVAQLPGAAVFGTTPASTPETVSFILRERNVGSLEAQVEQGVTNYLSVSQFASTYGQTQANISALTSYLAHFGITTNVYADNVDVSTTGTAGEFDQALSVTQKQYDVPAQAGRGGLSGIPAQNNIHSNVQAPLLPYRLSNFVLAILGLTNYGPYANHAVKPLTNLLKPQAGSSNYCLATFGLSNGCHLPSDFASMYNLNGLYNKGATGAGETVGIVTLAALDPGAPPYFWSNIAHVNRTGSLTVDNIDGGPGAPSVAAGSDETDLDVEQSGGLAPGANVIVYQAPNTDPGFADAFFTAASQNTAAPSRRAGASPRPSSPRRSCPARKRRPTWPRSTRPSSNWPRRGSPRSTPPVTRERTTTAATSAPPTCRSTPRRTARTSPRPAAPRCPGPASSPVRTVRPRSRCRPSASGAGTTCGRPSPRSPENR